MLSCSVVKWPAGTSKRSPLFENVHSKSTFDGSALTRQEMTIDSSNEAPMTVTPDDIQTGATARMFYRNQRRKYINSENH